MKKLNIQSIELKNFKGIESFDGEFKQINNIFGANRSGKSTLKNAILWCLFGKDDQERKDHEIKNTVKTELNRLDHSVEIVWNEDGRLIPIKRVYSEKWVKQRGNSDAEFSGHETKLFFDDVPMSQKDFQGRVNDLLQESIFKLITNPQYFNSLNWKDRRGMLVEMAGEITNELVAGDDPQFFNLLEILKFKSLEDYKHQTTTSRKKLQKEKEMIPVRIKEVSHGMPEELEWDEIENEIKVLNSKKAELTEQIENASKSYQKQYEEEKERLKQISAYQDDIAHFESLAKEKAREKSEDKNKGLNDLKSEKQDLGDTIQTLSRKEKSLSSELRDCQAEITRLESIRKGHLERYYKVEEEVFKAPEVGENCPTCGKPYDEDHFQEEHKELEKEFKKNKLQRIEEIKAAGTRIAFQKSKMEARSTEINDELINIESSIKELASQYSSLEKQIESFEPKVLDWKDFLIPNYQKTLDQIEALKASKKYIEEPDTAALKEERQSIETEIAEQTKLLTGLDDIKKAKARIKELEKEEGELAQKITELEGIEYAIEQFTNKKMTLVEESVNKHFRFVRFKMFNTLINGGTEDTCETMLDGVPWSTLNTEGQLTAGIDIINAFSNFYQVTAPIIIDNRESVTEIPETNCQIFNFFVSPNDKKLRLETLD